MHKPESVIENYTHKILWVFKIQTHHQTPVRRQKGENQPKRGNINMAIIPIVISALGTVSEDF